MRIVVIAAGSAAFGGTGPAAVWVEALPRALADRGHRVSIFLPLHRGMAEHFEPVDDVPPIIVRLQDGNEEAALLRSADSHPGVETFAVGADRYFDRPHIYGEGGVDYADSVRRFAFFCRASLGALGGLALEPEVIHCHDWPAALVPVYLRGGMVGRDAAAEARDRLASAAVVLSVHDLAAQGVFPSPDFASAGVPRTVVSPESIERHGTVGLLREGLRFADHIVTPSPRNARDVRTPEHGAGLQGLFEERAAVMTGILDGIDTSVWNPAADPHLVSPYDDADPRGKRRCKADLVVETNLDAELDTPIAVVFAPAAAPQGFDVLLAALPALFERGLRVVVVGPAEPRLAGALCELEDASARRLTFCQDGDPALTHKALAGSDLLVLAPGYEPCGSYQMVAQAYGTIPVVLPVGGLADTVLDVGAVPERGTGFWIEEHTREALVEALDRALDAYGSADVWAPLRVRAMRRDFSWRHVVARYVQIYRRLARRSLGVEATPRVETACWHGRVADDFTVTGVRAVAQGCAEQIFEEEPSAALAQRGILVAHDGRFLGMDFAGAAAGVLAWNDVSVAWSPKPVALPAVACAVPAAGLAGGVVLTAGARGARWNGVHLIGPAGAPASPDVARVVQERSAGWMARTHEPGELGGREAVELGLRREIDPAAVHRDVLRAFVDVDAIRGSGLRVACDLRFGTARGSLDRLLGELGVAGDVRGDGLDPTFGGASEPVGEALGELAARVTQGHDVGVAVDPSGCRLGIVGPGGEVVASDHVFALLLDHVAETRAARGRGVARSVATSRVVDAVALRRGLDLIETPAGFQELGTLLARGEAFFAADADALALGQAVPHPDGILAALLVVEMLAYRRRPLDSQLAELFREAGPATLVRRRVDIGPDGVERTRRRLADPPGHLGASPVRSVVMLDGVKLRFDYGAWLLARLQEEGPTLCLSAEAADQAACDVLLEAALEYFIPRG